MNARRTLILICVTVAAFAGSYGTGRATRPAGAPPTPAHTVAISLSPAKIRAAAPSSAKLPPLATPQPQRPDEDANPDPAREAQNLDGAAPSSQSPNDEGEWAPAELPTVPPARPGPSQAPPDDSSPPETRSDDDGDWSSGN